MEFFCVCMPFLSRLITYFQPFVISSQQQETSTTNVSLEMDTIYSGDISAKCATPKGAKTTSPIQLRPSNKLSHRRKLFKHMTLGKTFLSRTADGNEKMKTMETITTENKETFTCKHTSPHNLDHKKRFQLESTSVRSNEILRAEDSEGVREVDVNCLIDKLRVRRKTFIRSSTIHTSTASDEQFKSMSGSKITLGKKSACIPYFSLFILML